MEHLPAHVKLERGEEIVAVIRPDFEVKLLGAALIGVASLIVVLVFLIGLDMALGRPLQGIGTGMLVTFALMVGPLLAQRILSPGPIYVLTSRRLIGDNENAIAIEGITRLQVWLTGVLMQGVGQRVYLQHLIDPAGVARLIRDTIASPRRI